MTDSVVRDFAKACGAPDQFQLIVESSAGRFETTLQQPFAVLGKSPRSDIFVADERLSNRHAFLQYINGQLAFVDLHTDMLPMRVGWLEPGASVEFGPVTVQRPLNVAHAAISKPDLPADAGAGPVSAILFEVSGRGIRATWRMKSTVAFVGSSLACRIRLADGEVSRFHCALVNTPSGLYVVDLISTNGMAVDGKEVRVAPLPDGSQLEIGNFEIVPRSRKPLTAVRPTKRLTALPPTGPAPAAPTTETRIARTAADLPTNLASDELRSNVESIVSPLVLQLANLQQQAFMQMQQSLGDQFQQMMSMFAEAFWAMHRDSAKQVRKEFRQIRKLTSELDAVRKQLAELKPEGTSVVMPPPAPPIERPARPAARAETVETAKPQPAPAAPAADKKRAAAPIRQSPADMHAWLNQRVNEIQNQRQSSWQRIMSLLQGKSTAEPSPAPPEMTRTPN